MHTLNFERRTIAAFLLMISSFTALAQDLRGAWKLVNQNGKAVSEESIRIFGDNYFMSGSHTTDGAFKNAAGGNYQIKGKEYTEVLDFSTNDSSKVRKPQVYTFSFKKDEFTIAYVGQSETWKKVDGESTPLRGTWRFGARVNDDGSVGERRGGASPRQTIKILSGKYFQWAAFNYETREFFGTGGGTYQLKNDQYTETIRFFSRDNSRVGMSLTFACRLDGNDWFHKGKGTTGNPVSEVWERVE
jgi:hypothetical protein